MNIVIEANGPRIERGKTRIQVHGNVVYATAPAANKAVELKMDILVPRTRGRKPLVVWFPGGGFVTADKLGSIDRRVYVAEAGYVVASVRYRTISDGATYQDGVADAKAAIRYLRANADRYGLDPRAVAVWGEGAGGYLAAMVGTTGGATRFDVGDNLDQSSKVQAVIDQYGPSDLAHIGANLDPTLQRLIASPNFIARWVYGPGTKKFPGDDCGEIVRANPATYAGASDAPAFLFFHGTSDRVVSPSQTLLLHEALRAKGARSTRYLLWGAGHGDVTFMGRAMAEPWSTREVMDVVVAFLDERLEASLEGRDHARPW